MPTFLVCIHHFEAASPRAVHEFMIERRYGTLHGAVQLELPSPEVADQLRTKARWNTFEKFGFAFPEEIRDDEDYFTYHFSPFLKRQKTSFKEWNHHLERGPEGDFYTFVQDGWEYQDAKIAFLSLDEAFDEWGCVEVATARRDYENWKKSADARLEKPEDHTFYCLRECEEIAAFITMPEEEAVEEPPHPELKISLEKRKEKAMERTTNRLFVLARAVEIIVEIFQKQDRAFKYTEVVNLLEKEGWLPENSKFYKEFNKEDHIRKLRVLLENRPTNRESEKYKDWENDFQTTVKFYFERLVQGDREGMSYDDCMNEFQVKKKSLMEKMSP